MRPIWKGAISFGLVTIPVQAVAATENHNITLHRVHLNDGGRIRNRRVCEIDGEEVSAEDIARGYDTGAGTVTLTDDDFDRLPVPTAKTFDILAFVPSDGIDPLQMDRPYYLACDGNAAAKPYILLRDALVRSGKVAVGKVALRGREALALIRVHDGALTMHTLLWPDEIRPHSGLAPATDVDLDEHEIDLAVELMNSLDEVPEEQLHDAYREAMERIVTAKLEHRPVEAPAEPATPPGQVVDLMAALERSVHDAHESRAGGREPKGSKAKKSTARKPAKKTASARARKRA